MAQEKADTHVKYVSVYFHVYHVEKAFAKIEEDQQFDNATINAHVSFYLIKFLNHCFFLFYAYRMLLIQ